ncbi:hypothetical protein TNCV_4002751 [Trichonephila clavipes]|uniref:Uncharacterized protein n=1 Tax=Trichonephila clavipes TaxID=2585209 RepID=A0A8X6UZ90_TRICX|nr:hypothetical protein TNCV_4002751 [Trichonephila clavipes]
MYAHTLQDAQLIGYKKSPDSGARFIAFSQSTSSRHLLEDETFNDSYIINNLIDYEDGYEEPDFLTANTTYAGIQLSNK